MLAYILIFYFHIKIEHNIVHDNKNDRDNVIIICFKIAFYNNFK